MGSSSMDEQEQEQEKNSLDDRDNQRKDVIMGHPKEEIDHKHKRRCVGESLSYRDDDDANLRQDDVRNNNKKRPKRKKESRHRKHEKSTRQKKSHRHHNKKGKKKRKYSSSDDESSSSQSSSSSSSSSDVATMDSDDSSTKSDRKKKKKKKQKISKERLQVIRNDKLLAKLNARGETLEERNERRNQKRAAKIQARFGYTAEENPFNDPNLHETFTWTKKREKMTAATATTTDGTNNQQHKQQHRDTMDEIETIRRRRKERDVEREEMDRLRAEEARMKELENYDVWAKKEEEFHLEQQRKRSAIRLVEGREKPIDVLAKNLLLFGLTEDEKQKRAAVTYQERYNALEEVQKLDAELDEPQKIVSYLKLVELQELLVDIDAFLLLEKEAMGGSGSNPTLIFFWDALSIIVKDEIKLLQNGGDDSAYAKKMEDINAIFVGQSRPDLIKMKDEIEMKLNKSTNPPSSGVVVVVDTDIDRSYWIEVYEQLTAHLAKMDLSELHSKMLVRQLEKLEQRKEELTKQHQQQSSTDDDQHVDQAQDTSQNVVPTNVDTNFGNLEEELGLSDEVVLSAGGNHQSYSWQDRYKPRKPRYFNRVRTGFDWNKYNQTHYDSETPPPKIVQGYKFNIFYPDLVDPTKTPYYLLERADSEEFCILRFHAGPPYEDIAFKIINREWNKSRKRGFRSTFERGILSLYFNFTTHWYRR
jgi:hypothetical protein